MRPQQLHTLMQILLILIVLLVPTILLAQTPVDIPPGGADPDAPIDGGLSLLLAAGVGYGAKKLKEKRNKKLAEKEIEK